MKKVNILVVDDRPEGILAVQAVLDNPDYNIVTASSGVEALKCLLHDDFAAILMDVQMPIMNGFETAAVIKTREKSRHIPIVFMSAINQDEQYVYQGYGVGAVDYLLKPFDPYILRSKVAIFVDIYKKNQLIKEQSQKLHENELNRLEIEGLRRYQYLADAIPQIVFRVHANGDFSYFNRVWFEYTGLNSNNSIGPRWRNVIHPDDSHVFDKIFQDNQYEDSLECECRILNKFGEFRWHLVRMEAEKYADPTSFNSWLGTATDIQDQKQSEENQRFLSEAGVMLVSSLDFGLTLKHIAELAVPKLADWCSFDLLNENDELVSMAFVHSDPSKNDVVKDLYFKYLNSANSKVGAGKVLQTGESEFYPEISSEILHKYVSDKEQINLAQEAGDKSAIIVPIKTHNKIIGTLTFVLSVSGRRYDESMLKMAEELAARAGLAYENARLYKLAQESIEVRNDFLSIASHELNTPITSLKLQLQMTKKLLSTYQQGNMPIDRFNRSIESSVKQVERLINLVQVLLDVSRIQSGKFTFTFEHFNVKDLTNEVTERFKEILINAGCDLHIDNTLDSEVTWDKTRIEQVIINLLTNAMKYAPGKIELKVKKKGNFIKFTVKDFGKGIPENKLKTIFERFERVTNGDTVGGLGLGLYIVKQIVEGHHGEIEVKSEIDKGTCFCVTIPLMADQIIAAPPQERAAPISH